MKWLIVIGIVCVLAGCSDPTIAPTQPSVPSAATITAVDPEFGSTEGLHVTIKGAGFQPSSVVTFGGNAIKGNLACSGLQCVIAAPAHAAGPVDVAVTNADGQTWMRTAAFTYVVPESFEVNGRWLGSAIGANGDEVPLQFTVQNNALISVSCGVSGTVALSPPPQLSHGAFAFVGDVGTTFSGRITSPNSSEGSINIPPCPNSPWGASRE
jgi:hypothetical protein